LEKYSNKLLVTNLPETITMQEIRDLFPQHQSIDLKHKPKTRAIVSYSSSKEAMEMRMSLQPTVLKEKFRVIILPLNSDKRPHQKKKSEQSDEGKFVKAPRYFETSIE
jgi:RNA recognition motif-containing protein